VRHPLVPALCLLVVPFLLAEEPDPEPDPTPDHGIRKLDESIRNADRIGNDKVRAQRKKLLGQLERLHADLVRRGKKEQARDMKDRLLLAESLDIDRGLDTKLTVKKLIEKGSSNGRYRELLHVLHVPQDKANYNDFTDYGYSATGSWGGYNNLQFGHWVYVHPRWFIWKELKP
jgi:hypothetical protein